MEGLLTGMANLVNAFRPRVVSDIPVDLERIAKAGRQIRFDQQKRVADDSFHPSQLASPCIKQDVINRVLLRLIKAKIEDPMVKAMGAAYGVPGELLPRVISSEVFEISSARAMDVGTAFHTMEQQNYFGPSGQVLGRWECLNCGRIIEEPQTHPTNSCNNVAEIRNHRGKIIRRRPCREYGQWIYLEVRVHNEKLGIHGKVDLLVRTTDGLLVIVDIKTMNQDRWQKLDAPAGKDVVQLQIYMWLLDAAYGILRYVNKGEQKSKPKHYCIERDPITEAHVTEYIGTVNELVSQGRWEDISGICNKKTQVRAKRCPFSILCF